MRRRRTPLSAALVLAVVACGLGTHALAAGTAPARLPALPQGFPRPVVAAQPELVPIGRRLFYDTRLSGNGTQSCGSCHQQARAFTDGRPLAVGSTGEVHPRNTQSIVNVAYLRTLTWANPAVTSLEQQLEVPLFATHPVELGLDDRNQGRVLRALRRDPWYARQLARAFPRAKRPVSWTTIARSIAAFERSITSADSRYDRFLQGRARLTASERRGMELFDGERAGCRQCHGTFLFTDQATWRGAPRTRPAFHNTGLYDLGGTGAYPEGGTGLREATGRRADMGRFRAPSLRNVQLTAPYMHDGSIPTLAAVVDHYARGGRLVAGGPRAGDGRDNRFKDPRVDGVRLSARDRADLVAFLVTLTDRSVTRDPRFADPFRRRR